MSSQCLLNFLRTKNPIISNDGCCGGGNTKSKSRTWLKPRYIDLWDDFDYDSLQHIYGGDLQRLLQRKCNLQDCSIDENSPLREIYDEISFESLLNAWNLGVVNQALAAAQAGLENSDARGRLYMVKGSKGNHPGRGSLFKPDWAGIRYSHQSANSKKDKTRRDERKNLLPGESKLTKKWSSGNIECGPFQPQHQDSTAWIMPLSQIFTYCVRAKARYGYIITDKELVVLRIRSYTEYDQEKESFDDSQPFHSQGTTSDVQRSSAQPVSTEEDKVGGLGITSLRSGESGGALYYKVIPWKGCEGTDSRGMTVNLALWWLHMLAGQNNEIDEKYTALRDDVWNERLANATFSDTSSEDQKPLEGVLHNRASHPTPESIRVGKKRSRSSEDDDEEEEEYTPREKRVAFRRRVVS